MASFSDSASLLAYIRSLTLEPADVVEGVYRGLDPALAAFVGKSALWIVLGGTARRVRLAPHPLPIGFVVGEPVPSAPLADFESAARAGRLLDMLPER